MSDEHKSIDSLMTEKRVFPPPSSIQSNAYVTSEAQYRELWERSIDDPDGFEDKWSYLVAKASFSF